MKTIRIRNNGHCERRDDLGFVRLLSIFHNFKKKRALGGMKTITATKNIRGFTLIELMIAVAIIGILAAIAVPNFNAYRNKSRIACGIATAGSIRAALVGNASVTSTNAFPMTSEIVDWTALYKLCNMHGALLAETMREQGFSSFTYHGVGNAGGLDSCDNAVSGNECSDFCIVLRVKDVPHDLTGAQLELRTSGIYRQTL